MGAWQNGETGELGKNGVYLSDLFARALLGAVTGEIELSFDDGDAHVFFIKGRPVHASGTGVQRDYLGHLLVARGVTTMEVVDAAFATQQLEAESNPSARRPLGAILAVNAELGPELIRTAVETQLFRRVCFLAAKDSGRYRLVSGPNAEVEPIAAPIDGFWLLGEALRGHASDAELTDLSDALLGHAVKLTSGLGAQSAAIAPLRLNADEAAFLGYLDRPRKCHQLELVVPRRRARSVLKGLLLMGVLEKLPADRGMPIKEAVRIPRLAPAPAPAPAAPEPAVEPPRASAPPPAAEAVEPKKPRDLSDPLLQEIAHFQEKIGKVSYYELLEVDPAAPASDIRSKYTTLAKRLHPDVVGTEDEELAADARTVLSALTDAYGVLADAERRKKYDRLLATGQGLTEDDSGKASSAKIKYEMAVVHLRRRDYAKAREALKMAMEMQPANGLYKGTMGWAIFADPATERADALSRAAKLLGDAVTLSPNDGQLHYYYGRVHKERGDMQAARRSFAAAVGLDSRHKDAALELRLIDMRKGDKPEPAEPKKKR